MRAHETSLTGLGFPESLRWHEDALWFSDMFRSRVMRWVPGEPPSVVLDAESGCPAIPGGLGWLPDGSLLVVDTTERRVLRVRGDDVTTHVDLARFFDYPANDMVVDRSGIAYVGSYGFNPEHDVPTPSRLVRVAPTGEASLWGPDLVFPNGCAIASDDTFVVSETFADRVARVNSAGELVGTIPMPGGPDGLCVGASGELTVACAFAGTVTLASDGRVLWRSPGIADGPGAGPTGCYDVEEIAPGLLAVATASLDEELAAHVDTGAITLISTDTTT